MFLTVHATAGVAVSQFTDNIFIAFILGFFSHFLLDLIPHGDENMDCWTSRFNHKQRLTAVAIVDFFIAVMILTTLLNPVIKLNPVLMLAGALGAMLPDFIGGWSIIRPNKYNLAFQKIHSYNHQLLKKEIRFRRGIIVQVIFFLMLIIPLLNEIAVN